MGVTLADFQAEGTVPDFSERLIMCDIGFAIALAQSFKRFGGKESVPEALFRFSLRSSRSTKAVETNEKVNIDFVRSGSFLW